MTETGPLKRAAALRALDEVSEGMVLGLGTGSTVAHFLVGLAEYLRVGRLKEIVGVPTSLWTADRCRDLGIPLTSLASHPILDLTVDGTDEVDPSVNLIKGLGGALLREKMVAQAALRMVIIADQTKIVRRLGERAPLPVEVVQFGWEVHQHAFHEMGAHPSLRTRADGQPLITDNGNYIIDCQFPGGIEDPKAVEAELAARAGVVETGLFLEMAEKVYVADIGGITVIERSK